ncbi:MAG: FtsQ-type POTRA domain-containing protein [Kastovskya adunca ATA6-11-RM4]|jgi:cell division protein FtsQ|nr:FtsQ-type POTRA domain-containing protein [Kastovskya adunca ATA6-11-RM4]
MTGIASVSPTQLTTRRKQLQRARRAKFFQAAFRSFVGVGIAGGLIWVITLPEWVIQDGQQVVIEGNQFLSSQSIRSMLALSYPKSLLRVQPQAIAQQLEKQAPIFEATVTRKLAPPGLMIQVTERQPVAIALAGSQNSQTANETDAPGFLDEQGVWMPQSSYTSVQKTFTMPTLTVIGMKPQDRVYWSELYQAVSRSPVKIFEIDWQNPANLVLKTELGKVHFGPYDAQFPEQLSALDRMRELPTHVQPGQIAYIDLKNPETPSIQMIEVNNTPP